MGPDSDSLLKVYTTDVQLSPELAVSMIATLAGLWQVYVAKQAMPRSPFLKKILFSSSTTREASFKK